MSEDNKIVRIPLKDLIPDPFKLRSSYDEEIIKERAASIDLHGIRVPLIVRSSGDKYEIIDGNYRYKAAQYRKFSTLMKLPCMVRDLSDGDAIELAAMVNFHRSNFTFFDKAKTIKRLKEAGFSEAKIHIRLGFKLRKGYTSTTFNAYVNFEEKIPDAVKTQARRLGDNFTRRHSEALIKVQDHPLKQAELAKRIVEEKLSGPKAMSIAKQIKEPEKTHLYKTVPLRIPVDIYDFLKTKSVDGKIGRFIRSIIEDWMRRTHLD